MSKAKKQVRQKFELAVFDRAKYLCEGPECLGEKTPAVDAHHITDRHEMPKGGYVPENGIALCASCHRKAESYHEMGVAYPGYEPEDLYRRIGSSLELATVASEKLL